MSLDPVRVAALDVLRAVAEGAPLDPHLEAALARQPADRERRFLAELVKGTLVWQGRYDHIVARLSRRRPPREIVVRLVLRLGLHQVLAMNGVPAHAALDQSAELVRRRGGARAVGYVNGLLRTVQRRLARHDGDLRAALGPLFPAEDADRAGFLAAWHSFPRWLVDRWLARLGAAECAALCARLNTRAPVTLHVLAPASPARLTAELAAAGCEVVPAVLHPRALEMVTWPSRAELAGWLERFPALIVQDAAVQAATDYLLGDSDGPAADLCAAPGGKTFHWAAARPAARPLIALDRHAGRLRALTAAAKRVEHHPTAVVLADAERPPLAARRFAAVLVDGPCSGTGVLRRHPEGRWRTTPAQLVASGDRLLRMTAAAELVRPGGRLLYATCSLEPEENEEVLDAFRSAHPEFHSDPGPGGDASGARRWWPQRDGADGFFAARLRREDAR